MNKKVQVLRAFAIIAVVMIHSNVSGYAGVVIRGFINYAVALFVFLSGYLTKPDVGGVKGFYRKRLLRALVPYCVWSVLYTISNNSYDSFLFNFLTAQCCGIYYYIFVYAQLVLLTPLVGKLIRSRYKWIGWAVTPVSVVVIFYLLPVFHINVGYPYNCIGFPVWFIFYYLGMMLGNGRLKYEAPVRITLLLLLAALILSEAEGTAWYLAGNADMSRMQLRLTSILASAITMLLAHQYLQSNRFGDFSRQPNRLLAALGNRSFGIYLLHPMVMTYLGYVPGYYGLPFPAKSIVILTLAAAVVWLGRRILKKRSWYLGF